MKNRIEEVANHGNSLMEHARSLLAATADLKDGKIAEARQRVEATIDSGKELYQDLRDRTTVGMRAADEYLHENPYKSIAVGVAVGFAVMWLCNRRK